jgi:ribosomal protein S18 acetylase RimI-like enzyme
MSDISKAQIYEFYNHAITPSYRDTFKRFATENYEGINTEWTEKDIEFLVIKVGIRMIGLLVMIPYEDNNVHIMLIAVDEAYRKKGLGTKLLIYVAGKYHNKKISLNITLDRLHLINFYCKNKYAVAEKICLEENIVIMSLNHVALLAKIPLPEDDITNTNA